MHWMNEIPCGNPCRVCNFRALCGRNCWFSALLKNHNQTIIARTSMTLRTASSTLTHNSWSWHIHQTSAWSLFRSPSSPLLQWLLPLIWHSVSFFHILLITQHRYLRIWTRWSCHCSFARQTMWPTVWLNGGEVYKGVGDCWWQKLFWERSEGRARVVRTTFHRSSTGLHPETISTNCVAVSLSLTIAWLMRSIEAMDSFQVQSKAPTPLHKLYRVRTRPSFWHNFLLSQQTLCGAKLCNPN